jgi:hypothetical protein
MITLKGAKKVFGTFRISTIGGEDASKVYPTITPA